MILQSNNNEVAVNIIKLIGTDHKDLNIESPAQLRRRFMSFLARIQPRLLPRNEEKLQFITSIENAGDLKDSFNNDSILDDKGQAQVISNIDDGLSLEKKNNIVESLDRLKKIQSGHYELLTSIASEIFILPSNSARAGSTSQAIGVIWTNPKLSYSADDSAEILVHELTHQTMFIDELCQQHYNYDEIIEKANWPISAVLKISRPFDKVLHSAVVALEIILLRINFTGHPLRPLVHPPTDELLRQLKNTLNSMKKILSSQRSILRERGIEIVENIDNIAKKL